MKNIDPQSRVHEILGVFTDPEARAGELLCDRHPGDAIAVTVVDEQLQSRDITYAELGESSRRVAAALAQMGIGPGDRVATLMGKSPDLVATIVGIWRLGAVYVPLFTAFAPQAISMRLQGSGTKAVVTDPAQRPKLDPGPDMPADGGWQIVVAGEGAEQTGDPVLAQLLADADFDPGAQPAVTGGSGAIVHMFTSGTTRKPKGVVHPLSYVADWQIYLEYALGVSPEDVFWCGADPGWAYGLYTAIVGALAAGQRTILYEGPFDAGKTWQLLTDYGVTDFAAAPTVFRALRLAEQPSSPISLKRVSSAGEPLTPEVNEWALSALGIEVHDHFGQTEVGMVLANHHHPALARPIKEGSMGRALPGWEIVILDNDKDELAPVDTLGRLAIDIAASPAMSFSGYEADDPSGGKFAGNGRWYLLGDAARVDADGDFFFSARDDDVIIMAGYRIGPFEIESVLSQHEAVAECAVIGAPDAIRGEVLEAFVVLRQGFTESDELAGDLQSWVKTRYAAHAYPRAIHFASSLPKTPSGKIQRFVLRRQREQELKGGVR